jgi:hypothetical protein
MSRLVFCGLLLLVGIICGTGVLHVAGTAAADGHTSHGTRLTPVSDEEESVSAVISSHPQPMLANVSDDYQVVRLWPHSDALNAAREALDQQCEAAVFRETPFREFVAAVAEKAGVRISLDHKELENIGFDADTPITANLSGLSFQAGLREALEAVDLGSIFKTDHVEITSMDKALRTRETVLYPVIPGVDLDEVLLLIEETVSPDSWSHRGGPGTAVAAPAGMGHGLVISHNIAAHEEIEAVLRNLDGALWTPAHQDEDVTAAFVRTYVIDDDDVRAGLEERLLSLCNDSLPHGADADARIVVIGKSIVVQSRSRAFQVMAAQIITAIIGDDLEVEIESDDTAHASDSET